MPSSPTGRMISARAAYLPGPVECVVPVPNEAPTMNTLAHVSDLHLGRSVETDQRVRALCHALVARGVDALAVTGDVTHNGRRAEVERFFALFDPFLRRGRLLVVPGNHDRLGHDVGDRLMSGDRVQVTSWPGVYAVCFDSTGPHNKTWLASQGALEPGDIEAIAAALDRAPPGALTLLLLHHHLLPYPQDSAAEWLSSMLGRGWTGELPLGRTLIERLRGRCDLVLHGHRHRPGTTTVFSESTRPLAVFNAGASADLGHVRMFEHAQGRLLAAPAWLPLGARDRPSLRFFVSTWCG
jgi:Icc protein